MLHKGREFCWRHVIQQKCSVTATLKGDLAKGSRAKLAHAYDLEFLLLINFSKKERENPRITGGPVVGTPVLLQGTLTGSILVRELTSHSLKVQ